MLRGGSTNDGKLADSLDSAFVRLPRIRTVSRAICGPSSRRTAKPRGGKTRIITSESRQGAPELLARMEAERDRLVTLIEKRKAAAAAERSLALHVLGDAILGDYEHAKRIGVYSTTTI